MCACVRCRTNTNARQLAVGRKRERERRTMMPSSVCIQHYTWINSSIKKVGNISKSKAVVCGIRKGARLMCTRPLSSYIDIYYVSPRRHYILPLNGIRMSDNHVDEDDDSCTMYCYGYIYLDLHMPLLL